MHLNLLGHPKIQQAEFFSISQSPHAKCENSQSHGGSVAIARRNQFDVAKASFKKKMVEAAGGSNGSPWLFCIFSGFNRYSMTDFTELSEPELIETSSIGSLSTLNSSL